MRIPRIIFIFISSILLFSLFLSTASADPWTINDTLEAGLTDIGASAFPEVFYNNDRWEIIVGEQNGNWGGFYWLDSTWVSDPTIVNGLPDIGVWVKLSVFNDGDLKLITGEYYGGFRGFEWDGTGWEEDSSIVTGLPGSGAEDRSSPEVFYHNDTWKMIVGRYSGGFTSYYWNATGSRWEYDGSICAGLGDIGDNSAPAVYEEFDVLYLISGRGDGLWNGFRWSGISWSTDGTIITGLLDIGNYGAPTIFSDTGTWKLIAGAGTGYYSAYDKPFTNIAPVTSELKIEGEANNLQIPSGTTHPVFTWSYYDINDDTQDSYEIRVGTSLGISDMWASGTLSGSATSKAYGGYDLSDNTAYYVQARTYDGSEWSAWETGVFVIGISGTTPPVVVISAPVSQVSQQSSSQPQEPALESEPSKTIIEEVISFVTEPFNWILIIFSYLGAFLGRSALTSEDETLKDIIIDTMFIGTVAFVVVLFVNSFIPLIALGEFFSVLIFASAGFVLSLVRKLEQNQG